MQLVNVQRTFWLALPFFLSRLPRQSLALAALFFAELVGGVVISKKLLRAPRRIGGFIYYCVGI